MAFSWLQVQTLVSNSDIGFVAEGQPVEVKVSTYNFTKDGPFKGTVVNLSKDAVAYEDDG